MRLEAGDQAILIVARFFDNVEPEKCLAPSIFSQGLCVKDPALVGAVARNVARLADLLTRLCCPETFGGGERWTEITRDSAELHGTVMPIDARW
jgi:hypothetical protein